jgi:hypothetical protein
VTALLVVETAVLVVLCVLVGGLLRGYASVLRRLHQLDGGVAGSEHPGRPEFRTAPGVVEPAGLDTQRIEGRDEWAAAHDIDGVTLRGEIVSVRTVGVPHDTVLAFLSASCEGCAGFWHELAEAGWTAPQGSRLLVVTRGADAESPSVLSQLCPPEVDLVMSSEAWSDYQVPGSPYLVVTDGRTGRVKGEGSGVSFSQVGGLIRQSIADARHPAMVHKPDADRRRERDIDRLLLAAGIGPNDPSLFASTEQDERP